MHNTQQTQETIILALSGIRTHTLRRRAEADTRHRPRALTGTELVLWYCAMHRI